MSTVKLQGTVLRGKTVGSLTTTGYYSSLSTQTLPEWRRSMMIMSAAKLQGTVLRGKTVGSLTAIGYYSSLSTLTLLERQRLDNDHVCS